jgi:polyhydroxybutyrate depolymerase
MLLFFTAILVKPVQAQTNGTIQFDGLTRSYIVYVPSAWTPSSSWPLVFVLHGFTQSAQTIMNVSNFNAVADTGSFIVVYPNGIGNAWNTNSGMTGGSTANDVGFIGALTDTLQSLFNIDTTRVFSCGFSAGGYMSHRLACESPRCYAGIASVAGTMSDLAYNTCTPARPVPVAQIHGTTDGIVSYNGGAQGGKSVDDVVALWVQNNGCASPPVVTQLPDINTTDNSTVELSQYSSCNGGVEVRLYKVIGGGHQWPGTTAILGGLGTINRDINASGEIWKFFYGKSCVSIPTAVSNISASPLFILHTLEDGSTYEVRHTYVGQPFDWYLHDTSGRLLSNGTATGSWQFSKGNITPGVYLLGIRSGKTVQTFRIRF